MGVGRRMKTPGVSPLQDLQHNLADLLLAGAGLGPHRHVLKQMGKCRPVRLQQAHMAVHVQRLDRILHLPQQLHLLLRFCSAGLSFLMGEGTLIRRMLGRLLSRWCWEFGSGAGRRFPRAKGHCCELRMVCGSSSAHSSPTSARKSRHNFLAYPYLDDLVIVRGTPSCCPHLWSCIRMPRISLSQIGVHVLRRVPIISLVFEQPYAPIGKRVHYGERIETIQASKASLGPWQIV